MQAWALTTFSALHTPNYRRYFTGQAISLVGTWMQTIAQSWLVLELTGSGTALGAVAAAQFLPILLLAPYGGLLADRLDKRRLLLATQSALGAIALTLGILVVTGVVQVWMVVLMAVLLGTVTACDNPARQAFAQEMVGQDVLRNAVTLNSVLMNAARAVGPAVAGVTIAAVGTGICFLINAASFVAVLVAIGGMDRAALHPSPPAPREPGQVREGLAYVRRTPELLVPLMMLALVGTLAYEFSVVLPLLATGPLDGGAETYGVLTSAMGAGAIVGGLVVASRGRTGLRPLSVAAALFGAALLATAASPTLPVAVVALALTGAASVSFLATGNTTLQLTSAPRFRGRVMALWTLAFLGSTPLGGPLVGVVSDHLSPRAGLALGGLACLVAAAIGLAALARRDRRRQGPLGDEVPA
ncbi:MAG: MFS transporter [Thermoleophilia bacterium]